MAERRLPLVSVLHRHPDPAESGDPRVRELVAALATLEIAPPPNPQFRAELRAQLVAVAPGAVADGDDARSARAVGARLRSAAGRIRRFRPRRGLAVLTCTVAIVALLLGGAFWASRKALPGDTLYALKRAGESFHAALTDGNADKGKLLLSYAATRYNEIGDLLPKSGASGSGVQAAGAGIGTGTAALVTSTLGSADDDVRGGMQTIGAQAIKDGSGAIMSAVLDWYPAPMEDLSAIVARIPAGSLHERASDSLTLLADAATRARQLHALGDCTCLSAAGTDSLGPVPCTGCSAPGATDPTPPGTGTLGPTPGSSGPTPGSGSSSSSGSVGSPGSTGSLGSTETSGSTGSSGSSGSAGSTGSTGSTAASGGVGSTGPPTASTEPAGTSSSETPTPGSLPSVPVQPPATTSPGLSSLPVVTSPPTLPSQPSQPGVGTTDAEPAPDCSTIIAVVGVTAGACGSSVVP